MENDGGVIWCYSCKHRGGGEYDPYCENYCGDAWNGYEPDDEETEEEE